MIDRILYSDFMYGFQDIKIHFLEWWRLMRFGVNDPKCLQMRQWVHDFFTDMTFAVSRYCPYDFNREKFV